MDPFAPINGISLERYAELCVAMKDTGGDAGKCAAIAQQYGVAPADWTAAQTGWNARMADPSLMGKVALAYMPIYQAALAKSGPAATATYREYVSMYAALNVLGAEEMYRRCGITGVEWSQISTYWATELTQNRAKYPKTGDDFAAEKARIAAGGPPVRRGEDAGGARPEAGDLAAKAQGLVDKRFLPNTPVLVQWSDGNKYQGTVAEMKDGQVNVRWPNGATQWIDMRWIEKA